jgi:hypothetical protein
MYSLDLHTDQRCLKFCSEITSYKLEIRDSNVTLVCGEDKQIKAHNFFKEKWGIARS